MRRLRHLIPTATLSLLLGTAACENETLLRPAGFVPIDPLFRSYVSIGNSITAGFQSGGITDSVQRRAYPVLLAAQMRTPFFIPSMQDPGCPSLFINVFTQTRLDAYPCYLRANDSIPSPYISNVAVPGAEVMDAVYNTDTASNANALTTFFLGGRTQWRMMARNIPSFISVWIGNNDVLGAATNTTDAGDPQHVTPPATFAARYAEMMDSVDRVNPLGGVLIGVANVVAPANYAGLPPTQPAANGVPYFAYGSTYFVLDQAAQIPGPFTADVGCAPPRGDSVLVPFPFGGALIQGGGTLTCLEAETIQPAELTNLTNAVTEYNLAIADEATIRGWLYFDPNPTLDSLRRIPTQVAFFPNFGSPAPTPCSDSPFGLAFSCDAIHPAAATHKLLANKLIQAINGKYGTALAEIP